MASVEIVWSADSDGIFIAKRHTTLLLGSWADCESNGETAVNDICDDFFTARIWEEWIGMDDDSWTINVEIHSPSSIAGIYEVELERVTKSSARKREPVSASPDR